MLYLFLWVIGYLVRLFSDYEYSQKLLYKKGSMDFGK